MKPPSPEEEKIGELIAENLVDDGATLQMGKERRFFEIKNTIYYAHFKTMFGFNNIGGNNVGALLTKYKNDREKLCSNEN